MFFKAFNEETRKIFMDNIDIHNVLSFIVYQTNYSKNSYDELFMNQCYISSSIISKVTKINISKVKRILKELENEGYFEYVYKSTGGNKKPSIIQVNFNRWVNIKNEQDNKLANERVINPAVSIDNTDTLVYLEKYKKTVNKPPYEHLSINKSKNIYSMIQEEFNLICINLDKVKLITNQRSILIDKILEVYGNDINIFLKVFENTSKSSFLNGINKNGWRADFDWIINIENFTKIYEGKYKDKKDLCKDNKNDKKYDKDGYEII